MAKIILNLTLSLLAVPALACPEFSGRYQCKPESGPTQYFTLSKAQQGDQVVYTINGTKLVANGVPETRHKGDGFPTTYTASCEGSLRTVIQTKLSSAMCPSMPLAVTSTNVFTPVGSEIVMEDVTVLDCAGKEAQTIRHHFTCTRR